MTAPDSPAPARAWKRRILTWAALALILYLLFRLIPPAEVINEFRGLTTASLAALGGLSLLIIAGVCLIDAAALTLSYRRLSTEVSYGPILSARAATMLLASFVTLIGHAGLAAHIARKYRLPAGKAAGMMMLMVVLEIYGMIAVSSLSLLVLAALPGGLGRVKEGPIEAVIFMNLAAWAAFVPLLFIGRRIEPGPVLEKLRLSGLIEPLKTLSPAEIAALLGLKTALGAWQIFLGYYAFLIYGAPVPFSELFLIMPVAIVVSSIPITPARLGTTQLSWTFFFHHRLAAAVLVAFSLLLQFCLNAARWLTGAAALFTRWREFFPKRGLTLK